MAVAARDDRSWSFTGRGIAFGLAVSILWHLFWFFAVTIIVAPVTHKPLPKTALISLGPVLDDALIKTLVDARPEYSKAFYRDLSGLDAATELPVQTLERHEAGDVTSIPVGGVIEKTDRDAFFHGAANFSSSDYFSLEGDVSASQVLSRPEPPDVNDVRSTAIEFEVDSDGRVSATQIASSSGDETLDRKWEDHLRQWLFSPSPALGGLGHSKAKAVFRRSTVAPRV